MNDFSTYAWLIIAVILVAVEIATGTFYLLMLAIAAVVTWLAERMGASFLIQTSVFLISSILFCTALYQYRKNRRAIDQTNLADDLDAGEIITVTHWHNGVGSTQYRGAHWQVIMHDQHEPTTRGLYQIIRFDGNRLLVKPAEH